MKMINIYPDYCREVNFVIKDNIEIILSKIIKYPFYNVIITLSDGKTFETKFDDEESATEHVYNLANLINSED